MNIDGTIPKISKIAILLIVAFVLNILLSTLAPKFLVGIFDVSSYGQFSLNVQIATAITLLFGYLLQIIIAIWTYREAKKQNERPWIWAAFALFFGLIAVIAFYLILVIRELRDLRTEIKENQKN